VFKKFEDLLYRRLRYMGVHLCTLTFLTADDFGYNLIYVVVVQQLYAHMVVWLYGIMAILPSLILTVLVPIPI